MVGGGNSRKLGRGGGGLVGNRSAPPMKRPSPATPPVRLSLGRGGPTSTSKSSPMVEESFSLVRENPLNFAMAIKLVPDLVEEIKRVEAQGSTARIKFSAYPNSAEGNVISVGGKIFKFSWAPEVPDLCDIYEERQSGEDGNGLLVESGTSWRKLSVQRELDENTHNHLKMRSEEAERKFKSRKAIVLDHQNSSMKNQAKQLAAVESNSWRFKNRKELPSRKLKSETTQAIGSHKPLNLSTKTTSKGIKPLTGSPMSFQPDHGGPTSSPFTSGNLVKGHTSDVVTTHNTSKTKETHSRPPSSSGDKSKSNRQTETSSSDLKGLIMSLLMENHSNGMSLKALERAIGETMSCTARQIEPILKQVAYYQAPGRYLLKQGAETGSLNKPPLESGSSPQIRCHKSPQSQKLDQWSTHDATLSTRTAVNDEEQVQLRSTPGHAFDATEDVDILHDATEDVDILHDATEVVDILHDSPHLMDKKVSENNEGLQGSSSDSRSGSGSGSESDGSDSASHSKSKSSSSSDSESDASSSSKQASDEDVDIMSSDNEKQSKEKPQNSNPVPLKSPVQLQRTDSDSVDIGNYEKHDDRISDIVDIEKDSPMDNHEAANYPFPSHESQEPVENIKNHSTNYVPNDGVKSSGHERLHKGKSGKSKKRSDDRRSDERPHDSKRFKGEKGNELSGTLNSIFGDIANTSSPDEPLQQTNMGPTDQTLSTYDPTAVTYFDQGIPSNPTFESQQPALIFSEANGTPEARSVEKKTGKHDNSVRGVKHSERKADEKSKEETNINAFGKSPKINGRTPMLQRELSELELGEFREPGNDESAAPKKQFGRKGSFNYLENKPMDFSDSSRKKPSTKIVLDSRKPTPPNPEGAPQVLSKRKADHYEEDHARTLSIATPTLNQKHQSSEHKKVSENNSKSSRKVPKNAVDEKNDHVLGVVSRSMKESKKLKASKTGDSKKRKDAPLMGVIDDSRKKRESSPLESPYNKYEKEKPDLKGPIKNTSEYKKYVKEYQEKYESYCSLNKVLESYRDQFSNLGKDLETYKDRDMKKYHDAMGRIKSSFFRCGEKHKRLKKIFVVLHEELKHLKQMIKDFATSYVKN